MRENTQVERIGNKDNGLTWICINNPDRKSMDTLRRKYKFHSLDLEDCLSEIQRPKIDEYDDYLFLVLHLPQRSGPRHRIKLSEVDIFIGPKFIITIHSDNEILSGVFHKCKKSKETRLKYMEKGSGYLLYMIIDDFFEAGFPLSDDLSKKINEMEREVFDPEYSRDRLQEILLLKKDIINFRRIIMPQRAIVAQLEHKNKKFLPENLDIYFDDIVDKIEKLWNNLESLQELTVSLQETNESIISHNTNNVIKILTIFSVIMLPLGVITGFYGMNVDNLPFAHSPAAPLMIAGLLLGLGVGMVLYFRHKNWL